MLGKLSIGAVAALIAATQAAVPAYGGYGGYGAASSSQPAGYGAHSIKHSHPHKTQHTETSPLSMPSGSVPVGSATSNGAIGASSSLPVYSVSVPMSTGVAAPSVPVSTGASGTSNGAIGASSMPVYSVSVPLSTGVASPSVPLSTGVASPSVPLSTGASTPVASVPVSSSPASPSSPINSESAPAPYPIPSASNSGNSPIQGTGTAPIGTGSVITTSAYATETKTGDTTLTYTLGSGSSTTVVTTTIKHTTTETDVKVRKSLFHDHTSLLTYTIRPFMLHVPLRRKATAPLLPPARVTAPLRLHRWARQLRPSSAPTPKLASLPFSLLRAVRETALLVVLVERAAAHALLKSPSLLPGRPKPSLLYVEPIMENACVLITLQTASGEGAITQPAPTSEAPISTAAPTIISSAPYNNGTEISTKKHKTKCASTGFLTKTQGTGSIIIRPTGSGGVLPISGKPQPTGGYGHIYGM